MNFQISMRLVAFFSLAVILLVGSGDAKMEVRHEPMYQGGMLCCGTVTKDASKCSSTTESSNCGSYNNPCHIASKRLTVDECNKKVYVMLSQKDVEDNKCTGGWCARMEKGAFALVVQTDPSPNNPLCDFVSANLFKQVCPKRCKDVQSKPDTCVLSTGNCTSGNDADTCATADDLPKYVHVTEFDRPGVDAAYQAATRLCDGVMCTDNVIGVFDQTNYTTCSKSGGANKCEDYCNWIGLSTLNYDVGGVLTGGCSQYIDDEHKKPCLQSALSYLGCALPGSSASRGGVLSAVVATFSLLYQRG
eukprot:GHVU01047426.1.p1 GENE.GHVU01047426.1~~GHVU01047426.1.p1  ORF type:complete len:304 (+),score=29.79 GHVU01047426.1:122-1033(+)